MKDMTLSVRLYQSEDPINITTTYPFIFLRKYPKLKSNHELTVSPSLPLRPGSPGGP